MTDRYPAVARSPAWRPAMDPPPPIALDTPETPRERTNRLALAAARFVADERNRKRERQDP